MEKQDFAKKIIPYVKWGVFATIAIVLMFIYEKPFSEENVKEVIGAISNCFAVPGVLVFGMSGLTYLASLGAYDGLTYIISNFSLHSLIPGHHKDEKQTLYEYKQAKDEKGRKWQSQAMVIGLCSLGISIILLIVYAFL